MMGNVTYNLHYVKEKFYPSKLLTNLIAIMWKSAIKQHEIQADKSEYKYTQHLSTKKDELAIFHIISVRYFISVKLV